MYISRVQWSNILRDTPIPLKFNHLNYKGIHIKKLF